MASRLEDLLARPVAALGTLHDGHPLVSLVAVATDPEGFLVHVSHLSAHTRDMQAHAEVSLLFAEDLAPGGDPLAIPRLTVTGHAEELPLASDRHHRAASRYLARFPQAEAVLGLGGFVFFHIRPSQGRLVAGFGQARTVEADTLLGALGP